MNHSVKVEVIESKVPLIIELPGLIELVYAALVLPQRAGQKDEPRSSSKIITTYS